MSIYGKLKQPFPPARISWRVGSTNQDKTRGMALAYIDSRDVQDRLDEAVGPGNWQCRFPHAGAKTVCEIGIKIDSEWIWKADGAGDSDIEAEKGALSDAFKRSAVKWGIGRYLYDVVSPWVELEAAGRSYKIKDSEYRKLTALLGSPIVEDFKAKFTQDCKVHIANELDAGKLLTWWSSAEQKKMRRDFELTQAEVDELKALVVAKVPKKDAP